VDDLKALDSQQYDNLLFVKYYTGDVEALGLTMTIVESQFGLAEEIQLVPGGANIPVTRDNSIFYIMNKANYMLNLRTAVLFQAFVRGLRKVIP
jgi:ubiquitin-protein ligase E3 C